MSALGAMAAALLGFAQPQLRGPVMLSQQEALEFRREALSLDLEARIERSYQHGTGWEYRVWVDGPQSRGEAELAAERLAARTGRGVAVFDEGEEGHSALPEPLQAVPSSEEVRKRMLRALGGDQGARQVLSQAESLELVFTRTLGQEAIQARHRFARAKGRQALTVEVDEGVGLEGWRVVSGPAGAWLQKAGALSGLSKAGANRLLASSHPAEVYRPSLQLPALLGRDEDFQRLQVVGQQLVERRNAVVLRSVSRHGQIEIVVDAETWLPSSISYVGKSGETQRLFLGWKAVESQLVLPVVMETRIGGLLSERIRLDKLSLLPLFSEQDFSVQEIP
ncbi:MAG: hypothetical protein VXW32_03690 [Myxococcota bacterium]|nr:hypothetical protein [Myxococcota bacterium]